MTIEITGENLIAGNWQAGAGSSDAVHAVDPATGDAFGVAFGPASGDQIAAACEGAWESFGVFRGWSAEARASLLDAMADEIEAIEDQLVPLVVKESALPEARVRNELGRTTGQLRLFSALLRTDDWNRTSVDPALPDREPAPKPELRLNHRPVGPVAVFGASNFPLAFSVAGGDTASALAAGCPVVVKAHPAHPGTCELVARALNRAVDKLKAPAGLVSLVHGGAQVGQSLTEHPRIRAVGFTGSRQAGRAIMATAAARAVPIPVFAEMSSVNPVFVLPGALAARTDGLAEGLSQSICLGAGQFCTNPGLVFVIGSEAARDEFAGAVATHIRAAVGMPMLTPGIAANYAAGLDKLDGVSGVERVATGIASGMAQTPALFRADLDTFLANDELQEEVFGASSLIIDVPEKTDLSDLVDRLEGQLTVTLHVEDDDMDLARRLLPLIEDRAGRVLVNGFPTGVEVSPAMVHGGPFPATSDGRTTSVGTLAIDRFLRPVCYQNFPSWLLPDVTRQDP